MSARHEEGHEHLIEAILLGASSERDGDALAQLESCAECRQRLRELRTVSALLDEAAQEERATLAEALQPEVTAAGYGSPVRAALADAEQRASARSRVAARQAEGSARALRGTDDATRVELGTDDTARAKLGPIRRFAIPLAAAALLLVAFVLHAVLSRPAGSGEMLGGGGVKCLAPVGQVGSYTRFEARASLPPGGWFEIRVYDEGAAPGSRAIVEKHHLPEPQWIPSAEESARLPDKIRWRIEVWNATREMDGFDEEAAWRSR